MSEFNFNSLNNDDCMEYMKTMPDGCVDLTLTDIPYGEVNRDSNGLRTIEQNISFRTKTEQRT